MKRRRKIKHRNFWIRGAMDSRGQSTTCGFAWRMTVVPNPPISFGVQAIGGKSAATLGDQHSLLWFTPAAELSEAIASGRTEPQTQPARR